MATTKFKGYIGTYTNGDSEGIYSFELDTLQQKITNITLAAKLDNPTYLCISEDKQNLYSVVKENENGGVASYSLDEKSGELTFINQQLSAGSPPCHVSVDTKKRYLLSANYHKGTVESYLLNDEISPPVTMIKHEGTGPDPRQEKAHLHFAAMTPDEKFVVAIDLGSDKVFTYQIGSEGQLTEIHQLSIKPGSGPRHLAFHPKQQNIAYLMTEFSSEVIVLSYHQETGKFTQQQTISTLPEGFLENNQGSAIHVSSDGRFVYAANRGHNSLAIFSINPNTGNIQFIEHVSTEGDWPRDFVLDPSEEYLIASNQNSSNLVLYARNQETGKLSLLQSDITVPNPVCVKFIK